MKKVTVMLATLLVSTGFAFAANMSFDNFAKENKDAAAGLSDKLEAMHAAAVANAAEATVEPLVLNDSPVQMVTMTIKKKVASKIKKEVVECPGVVVNDSWIVISKYCGAEYMNETVEKVPAKNYAYFDYSVCKTHPELAPKATEQKITYNVTYSISHNAKESEIVLSNDPSMGDYYPNATKPSTSCSKAHAKNSSVLGDLIFLNFGKGAFANVKKANIVLHNKNGKLTTNTNLEVHNTSCVTPSTVKNYLGKENFSLENNADNQGSAVLTKSNCLVGFSMNKKVVHHISMEVENLIKSIIGEVNFVYLP